MPLLYNCILHGEDAQEDEESEAEPFEDVQEDEIIGNCMCSVLLMHACAMMHGMYIYLLSCPHAYMAS